MVSTTTQTSIIFTILRLNSRYANKIKARRCDMKLWSHIENEEIHEDVFNYITSMSVGGVFKTEFHKLDHALVTTLVELWRLETHIFHFPMGEASITLQDV